jgi:hypothetical protein
MRGTFDGQCLLAFRTVHYERVDLTGADGFQSRLGFVQPIADTFY